MAKKGLSDTEGYVEDNWVGNYFSRYGLGVTRKGLGGVTKFVGEHGVEVEGVTRPVGSLTFWGM